MAAGDYLAIDWGTTNRRIYRMRGDGSVAATRADAKGVLATGPDDYPSEISAIREEYGDLPVIAAGMVGSTHGWIDVPYSDAPAGIAELAGGIIDTPVADCRIVPGIAYRENERCDVMRGEEVQVFGAVANGSAPADALFCQPGTHNKWIATRGGAIVEFATALTGELFALLRSHGILAGMLDGPVRDGAAFRDGVARGMGSVDLPVALFEVRASVLLGKRAAEDAAAFASGILIGADVGARADLPGRSVQVLATGSLADLYHVAITLAGGHPEAIDSHQAFAAGIHAIRSHCQ